MNAANRAKDWEWIRRYLPQRGVDLDDASAALAMISLQGPHAAEIMCGIVSPASLLEAKRNRLSIVRIDSTQVIVARTGYTGESVCFGLFPPRAVATALWEKLALLGAVPCGLGARDSLRLEAGLPLYGHELGSDPEGNEIPIFANDLARFAVRASGTGDCIGRAALETQRAEFIEIRRGTLKTPLAKRADLVTGSTHKTFFGPQRGVILSDIDPGSLSRSCGSTSCRAPSRDTSATITWERCSGCWARRTRCSPSATNTLAR